MARFFSDQRGDTLLEVTFALTILSTVLISTTTVVTRAVQLGQTAKERLVISEDAQRHLEALRAFRDNHTWKQFTFDGDVASGFKGVLTAATNDCVVSATCLHTEVKTGGGIQGSVPVAGKTSSTVPSSYLEVEAIPDDPVNPTRVDVTVSYGFDPLGGGEKEVNHIKTVFVDLRNDKGLAVPPCIPRPKDVILTLDASSSMSQVWDTMTREAKLKLVVNQYLDSANIGAATNHAALVQFNAAPTVLADFSGDIAALKGAMGGYTKAGRTYYSPPLNTDIALFGAMPPARPGVVKVVVFITDGLKSAADPDVDVQAAITALKGSGVRIYTIGIIEPTDPDFAAAKAILQPMAGNGGYFATADSEADLTAIINDIAGNTASGC